MNEHNYVTTNYPEYQKLYEEAIQFYNEQLDRLYGVGEEDNDELIFKLTILQFSIAAHQCLTSVYKLLQTKEFFTPLTILRNMVEYAITAAYIEQEPKERSRQYTAQGIKIQLKLINAAKKYPDYLERELRGLVQREEEVKTEYEEFKTDIEAWQRIIEQRAIDAGIPHIYDIHYRLLSMNTHLNSTTSKEFFTEIKDKKIIVHNYKKDTTKLALATALEITNIFMNRIDEHYKLGQAKKYEELRKKIEELPAEKTYYKLISHTLLEIMEREQALPTTPEKWNPYPRNIIIPIFETDDPDQLIQRYARTLADSREEEVVEGMYLLKIEDPPGKIEIDKSRSSGWEGSRVHYGPIPIIHVTPIRKILFDIKPGYCQIEEIINLENNN